MNSHAPARHRLPDRRQSISTTMHWNGQPFHLTFGFNEHGRIAEIFGSSPKVGSDTALLVADAAVAISLGLQAGLILQAMARSMSQSPDPMSETGHKPASLLGAILRCAFQIEGELWA